MLDPAALSAWANAIDTLGSLGLVILAVWAFYTRRVRVRGEVDDDAKQAADRLAQAEADHNKQLAYVEDRRADERAMRMEAEARLLTLVGSIEKMSDVLQAVQTEMIRGHAAGRRGS